MAPNFVKRVMKDIIEFKKDLPEYALSIYFDENKLTEIYFLLKGSKDTPYSDGEYIFKLMLPNDYPIKPPDFLFLTPTGRFIINTKICSTFSSHHKESWSPCYNFNTLFTSIISFMNDENSSHVGGMKTTNEDKIKYAKDSKNFNKKLIEKLNLKFE